MEAGQKPVYYSQYLMLEKLLDTQYPKSREYGKESHDETLFIIVHQAYELWFKQILHELNFILDIFQNGNVQESDISKCVQKADRIIKIQKILIPQFEVLETMTPMDFLEFRDLLIPASGFQSMQFREIEIKMGIASSKGHVLNKKFFLGRFNEDERKKLEELTNQTNLFELIHEWLERMPFTESPDFDFWSSYKVAVEKMLDSDKEIIASNASLMEEEKQEQIKFLDITRETFNSLLDRDSHDQLMKEGKRKFSQKATLNALFILLYRNEPLLTQPHSLLKSFIDIDTNFTEWRHRHALLAHRMLGTKIGTGGTSGHEYLRKAAINNQIYFELFDLSTFLIPTHLLPPLPEKLRGKLGFNFKN